MIEMEPAVHTLALCLGFGGETGSYISVCFCTLYIFYSVVFLDSCHIGDGHVCTYV